MSNALLSALLFSFLLAVLVVDLNINLTVTFALLLKLTGWMMITYGLLVALGIAFIHTAFLFVSGKKAAPAFFSPSFLSLSTPLLILLALIIIRENTAYFAAFFVPGFQSALKIQMIALFILAVTGLVAHYEYRHHRPRRVYFVVYFSLLVAVLGLTVYERLDYPALRKPARMGISHPPDSTRRVTLLGLEGLSFDFILPLIAEGKLPNFAALMETGAWGRLEGFTPNDPFILRHTLITGKSPGKHRRISDVRYSMPGLRRRLEIVPRFILFRQLTRFKLLTIEPNDDISRVKDLWRIAADSGLSALAFDSLLPETAPPPPSPSKNDKTFNAFFKDFQVETSPLFDGARRALLRDAEAEDLAFRLKAERQPRVFSLVLNGLNAVESVFYRYSIPEAFGDIKQEEILRYGPVIGKYYQYYDQIIGKTMAALKDDELLVVYSPHGIEPLPFWKRMVEWILGNSDVSAYHEQAPDGAVFFFGRGVDRGKNAEAVKIVDILPTLLYFLRLPVGKDMDGVVRGTLFTREFTQENPVFTITSYEDVEIRK